MRDAICLECRATVDECWRWCPECGSLRLLHPGVPTDLRWGDDFAVEWEIEDGDHLGRFDDHPEVGSSV
ncbi:MAG TPA: hypothetical protein VFH58_09310 [Acidimicrobiales bacterium]|nr:hypothetical protein [Acidimicrobiales bacterium]